MGESMSKREPGIVREFRELYEYVYELGQHINEMYKRLEVVENTLKQSSDRLSESTMTNMNSILDIKAVMVTKSEFDEFIDQLKSEVGEKMPSLPPFTSKKAKKEEESE